MTVVQLIRVTGVNSTSELCRRGQVWGAAGAGGAEEKMDTEMWVGRSQRCCGQRLILFAQPPGTMGFLVPPLLYFSFKAWNFQL